MNKDFKRKVEQAIGAFKYDDDTWGDVIGRVNAEGGIDNKMLMNVLICILEEMDNGKDKTVRYEVGDDLNTYTTTAGGEAKTISSGTAGVEEEVQPRVSD